MAVSVEELIRLKGAWRDSLAECSKALEERYLEEIEDGTPPELAAARANVAVHSLREDTVQKLKALEAAEQDYVAHGDAALHAAYLVNQLDRTRSNESQAS